VRDLTISTAGLLQGETSTLSLSGDWTRSGAFVPGTGRVTFQDGCARFSSAINSDNTFADLYLTTTTGRTFQFEAGRTQTIARHLSLSGSPGDPLRLRSSVGGASPRPTSRVPIQSRRSTSKTTQSSAIRSSWTTTRSFRATGLAGDSRVRCPCCPHPPCYSQSSSLAPSEHSGNGTEWRVGRRSHPAKSRRRSTSGYYNQAPPRPQCPRSHIANPT
jgi:hypothetical protein